MKAVGYARVSTEKQADTGASLEAQVAKIKAAAELKDAELVDVIVDGGASAKSLDRPGLDRVLELVRSKAVDAVIVFKLDRLTRSVRDLADLLELFSAAGVSLVSTAESLDTSSAAGRLVLNIMASVSQWEREAIGERTAAVLRHKRDTRKVYGSTPYGFCRKEKDLVADPRELATMERIRRWRSSGKSLRAIADQLNAEGVATKKGGRWYASTVRYLLENSGLYAVESAA